MSNTTRTASEWSPTPPDGYRHHDPGYEQPWYVTKLVLIWILSVVVGVPVLIIAVHGVDTALGVIRAFSHENLNEWLIDLVWIGTTIGITACLHELIHAFAGYWFGLGCKFGLRYEGLLTAGPEVLTYGGFQSIRESVAIALLPLIFLTPASLSILIVGQNAWMIATAMVVAFTNSIGAIGDIGSALLFCHLPTGELIYHDSEGRRQYYTPVNEER